MLSVTEVILEGSLAALVLVLTILFCDWFFTRRRELRQRAMQAKRYRESHKRYAREFPVRRYQDWEVMQDFGYVITSEVD